MRIYWGRIRIRERRRSCTLIKMFLKDSLKLGTSMSQVYKYRSCVKKVSYIYIYIYIYI